MENNLTKDEIEIDLGELFRALWAQKWMIILSGIFLALLLGVYSKFFIAKQYESTTKVYVINRQESSSLSISDLQSGTQLTKDYQVLIASRTVLEQVISELDLSMTYSELASVVTVEIPTDTRLLTITVTNEDPYLAREIAIAIREAASAHITSVMATTSLNVADEASLSESPSSPNVKRNALMGGALGAAIAMIIILIIFILDDTIKTPDDVVRYLEVSVLGSIPAKDTVKGKKKGK